MYGLCTYKILLGTIRVGFKPNKLRHTVRSKVTHVESEFKIVLLTVTTKCGKTVVLNPFDTELNWKSTGVQLQILITGRHFRGLQEGIIDTSRIDFRIRSDQNGKDITTFVV